VAAQVERGNDLVLSGEFSGISVSPPAALPEIVGGVVFLGAAAPIGGAETHGIPIPVGTASSPALLDAFAAFFCLGDALRFPELVDHEVPLVAFHHVLQLFVLVAGSDDEAIALFVRVLILGKGQVDSLGAVLLSALADDGELILRSFTQFLAHLLNLSIDRPVYRLVSRNALMTGIHGWTINTRSHSVLHTPAM
jgi:hypothetical protein